MATPEFAADPYSFIEAARNVHPWIARCENGYCVFEYSAIRELMLMDDRMRPSFDEIVRIMDAKSSPWGRFTDEQMIALPDREHRLLRDTFAAKFTPRFANRMRPAMRDTMNRLLDEWAPKAADRFRRVRLLLPGVGHGPADRRAGRGHPRHPQRAGDHGARHEPGREPAAGSGRGLSASRSGSAKT